MKLLARSVWILFAQRADGERPPLRRAEACSMFSSFFSRHGDNEHAICSCHDPRGRRDPFSVLDRQMGSVCSPADPPLRHSGRAIQYGYQTVNLLNE